MRQIQYLYSHMVLKQDKTWENKTSKLLYHITYRNTNMQTYKKENSCNLSIGGTDSISFRYYKTPTPRSGLKRLSGKADPENCIMLPPFVQIETLHPGQTFVSQ